VLAEAHRTLGNVVKLNTRVTEADAFLNDAAQLIAARFAE
jgi:hypothetical protein